MLRLFSVFVVSLGFIAQAKASKEIYATEALRGMPAYISHLFRATEFNSELTIDEKKQLRLLNNLIVTYANMRFPRGGGRLKPFPLIVKFSSDQEKFKLNPDEPRRSAMTTEDLQDPIWFNLEKLNKKEVHFLDVIQIMIHEFGHKLGRNKDQEAVDSLAAKIRAYLVKFYREKITSRGEKFELLALPIKKVKIRNVGDEDLREIHLFMQKENKIYKIKYDIYSHFGGGIAAGSFTPAPRGIGNFDMGITLTFKDIEIVDEKKLMLNLVLELQENVFYYDPMLSLDFGSATPNGPQNLPWHSRQIDLVRPQVRIAKIPLSLYINSWDELQLNFTFNQRIAWEYNYYEGDLEPITKPILNLTEDGLLRLDIQFSSEDLDKISTIAIEVSDLENKGTHLILGEKITNDVVRFQTLRRKLKDKKAFIERLIIDNRFQYSLEQIIHLPDSSRLEEEILRVGSLHYKDDAGNDILYDRTKRVTLNSKPVELSCSTNFEVEQVRLRWIKGVDLYLKANSERDLTHLGIHATVIEEVVDIDNFWHARGELRIKSLGVHKKHSVDLLFPQSFEQRDNGYRELKEIILVSKTGQTKHLIYTSLQKIFNQEFFKVPIH